MLHEKARGSIPPFGVSMPSLKAQAVKTHKLPHHHSNRLSPKRHHIAPRRGIKSTYCFIVPTTAYICCYIPTYPSCCCVPCLCVVFVRITTPHRAAIKRDRIGGSSWINMKLARLLLLYYHFFRMGGLWRSVHGPKIICWRGGGVVVAYI